MEASSFGYSIAPLIVALVSIYAIYRQVRNERKSKIILGTLSFFAGIGIQTFLGIDVLFGLILAVIIFVPSAYILKQDRLDNVPPVDSKERFYQVGDTALYLLTIITGGFYLYYWSYRHWSKIKQDEGSNIHPVFRAIFSVFYLVLLFEKIKAYTRDSEANKLKPVKHFLIILIIGFFSGYIVQSGLREPTSYGAALIFILVTALVSAYILSKYQRIINAYYKTDKQ